MPAKASLLRDPAVEAEAFAPVARRTASSPTLAPPRRAQDRLRASVLEDSSALRWRYGERLDDVLEDACRRFAEREAVALAGVAVSYAELNARADQMARFFIARGVKAGDRVGVLLDRGAEAYVALFGLLKVRASYVPLDPNHPAERIRYILADAGASLVVSHMRLADRFADLEVEQIVLDRAREDIVAFANSPLGEDERGQTDDPLCYVLYTSGTTGHPKGVAVAHPSICNFVRVAAELYGFGPGERVYQGMSIAFDFSIEELWVPLVAGATLVPNMAAASLFGEELAEFLEANEVTCFCCVPTLLASIERELPRLKILLIGGEACPPAIVKRWSRPGRTLLNSYGPTETTVTATLGALTPDKPVTIGKPLPTYSIVILDPARDEALDWGEAGEIGIAGVGVAEGYLNRRELTDAKFIADFLALPNNRSERIYRTGDLGRLTEDGEIEYLGRIDTQVKLRGYRIELTEIESVLLEIADVAQVVATTFEPAPGAPELVAYYSVKHGAEAPKVDAIVALMRERLPTYMTPAYLERLPFIPTLVSNKADRSKLPAPKSARLRFNARHTPPATPTEHLLCRALQETLNLAEVSVDADFFNEYGAHSLLMARFCAKVRQLAPQAHVAMRDVYTNPNVRRLAYALDSAQPTAVAALDYAPAYEPSTFSYVACGAAQAGVYVASLLVAIAYAVVVLHWTTEALDAPLTLALRSFAAAAAAFFGLNGLAIAGKWALIGASRAESIPVWSLAYFRFWLAKHLIGLAPARAFAGTPIYNLFLTALGARIGRHAVIGTLSVPVAAHRFQVGGHAVVARRAVMQGYVAVGNRLHFGDVRLGKHAYVGEGSVLDIDTAIGDFSQLGHASSLQAGQRVPDGKRFHGSPAEETATSFRLIDEFSCSSALRVLSPALQLTAMGAIAALGGVVATLAVTFWADVVAEIPKSFGSAALDLLPGALWTSMALLSGSLAFGLATIAVVPRLGHLFLKEGKIYPLFGFHHAMQRMIEGVSNSTFFNQLFGDSVAIEGYLRLVGWRIGSGQSTGSNFGTSQTHENPFLCVIGEGTVASDGLNLLNVTHSSHAFRLGECRIGANNFLGTDVYVPPGVRTGDNCLFATKVMAPIDGPVRQNVGLLGSPAFEIPRVASRDAQALASVGESERPRRLALKNRHNLKSALALLGAHWFVDFSMIYCVALADALYGPKDILALAVATVAGFALSATVMLLIERAALGFGGLRPEFATVYDPAFWRIERYWKLNESFVTGLFAGTPFRSLLLRLMGVKVGRKIFDDGGYMSERPLVELGDGVNLNAHSVLQAHSLEDGVFKSDFIRIGARVSVGVSALVHYGVTLHDDAIVDADSFVMKGEIAPAGSRWRGNPAKLLGAAVAAKATKAA